MEFHSILVVFLFIMTLRILFYVLVGERGRGVGRLKVCLVGEGSENKDDKVFK